MKVSQTAQVAARLAVVNDKIQSALAKSLAVWFSSHFVKGIKLQLLQDLHRAGAFAAFSELLTQCTDAERLSVVKKVEPHLPDLLTRSLSEQISHLEALASGRLLPSGKAKTPKAPKAPKKKQVSVLSSSKY